MLAKNLMEAIPIYPMMTNLFPKSCIKDIHKIQRELIWGDTDAKKKVHAVKWENVTKAKCDGSLGLRDLNILNNVCIMKLGSKINNGNEDLWCDILRRKYNVEENGRRMKAKATDSNLWKAIVKTAPQLLEIGKWRLGDGNSVSAWSECWIEQSLCLNDINESISTELHNANVKDLVGNDCDWDWNIMSWILADIRLKIAVIVPPCSRSGEDKFLVANNEDG